MAINQFHELLQHWTRRCPGCGQAWLVVDTRENSLHTCKACGHEFLINENNCAEEMREGHPA